MIPFSGRDDSLASTTSTKISTETDEETMDTVLQEQQTAWEDATTNLQIDTTHNLDPPLPLNHQMICDIPKNCFKDLQQNLVNYWVCQVYLYHMQLHVIFTGKFTTNLAEGYMHIRCKFDGGKQVNRSPKWILGR